MTQHDRAVPAPATRSASHPVEPVRRSLASLVLALVTGLPLASAGRLVPDADDRGEPYVGV